MDDNWETAADERPKIPNDVNKWQGEDDDDDVKDCWEDEEEKKDEEKSEPKVPTKAKPNKVLKAKLTEQERLAEEEEEERRLANLTPEERMAEKLRLKQIQEESDLKSALETFGVTSDCLNPQTIEEFKKIGETLSLKLSQYKESPHFPQFVEDLVRGICVNLSASDIKKVKINVETLHTEKLKMEKPSTKKPSSKGKVKATIRADTDDIDDYKKYGNDYGEDYDDFM